jgi:ABC-type uncharacterized transport system permease subunit
MAAAVKRGARQEPPEAVKALRRAGRALVVPLGSVLLAFFVGGIIVLVTGGNPLLAYQALLCGGFGLFCFGGEPSVLQISNTLVFVTPLIMAGIAVALPFRAGMFNIGAEGQLIMGAILATTVGIHFGGLPAILLIPFVLLAGVVGGLGVAHGLRLFAAGATAGLLGGVGALLAVYAWRRRTRR